MNFKQLNLGTIRVNALEMIQGIPEAVIGRHYSTDTGGKTRIAMNGLIVDTGDRIVCFDPGCATFLSRSLAEEYDLVMDMCLEDTIRLSGYAMDQVTDVVFTHLHFDHGSGAFKRIPGGIIKAFPNARYMVSREQLAHIESLDSRKQGSFFHKLLKFAGDLTWADDWDVAGIRLLASHGHTKHMLVPVLDAGDHDVLYATDLVPMKLHLMPGVSSYYDEDKPLLQQEKEEIIGKLRPGTEIIFYHEPLPE